MKNVYAVIFAMCACLLTLMPQSGNAQCLCSGGVPATQVTYTNSFAPTNASPTTISFPKFDPSIGTLSCVTFDDTISGITTTNVWNLASVGTIYEFLLTVSNSITGPGVSVLDVYTKVYGPDSLNAMGVHPGDSILYGPDQLFNNTHNHNSTTNVAPYLGTVGTVNFSYSLNGGLISLIGSLNYGDQIVTNYWGSFRLTYYWCPAIPLAKQFSYFSAAKNGSNIQIQWQAQNEQLGVNYEIEYSKDGAHFMAIGNQLSDSSAYGKTANYQFMYPIASTDMGKLFFRIKRISEEGGAAAYSDIKTVNLSNTGISSYRTYPNPVSSYTVLEFDEVLTGDYSIELVNTAGQVVQRNTVSLAGTNLYKLDLNSHPATGLYFLRVTGKTNSRQYLTKLIIE